MFKQIAEIASQLFGITRDIRQSKDDITALESEVKELRQDVTLLREQLNKQSSDLTRAIERLAFEISRVRDSDIHEREKMALQLENALLKFERRLPSSKTEEN